jgi:4-hydroxybenzoate polyprenyltransferase
MAFAASLAAYYAITLLYTFALKRQIVIDVFTLAGLYTMRVIAGGGATGIAPSEWLLAFSMFLFLSLALIKRYAELVERQHSRKSKLAGRGYVTEDTPIIGALAGASGFVSVLVLALYINSPDVLRLYPHPHVLWGLGVLLLYWVSRVLMLAHRGEIHDDPLVFAVTDRMSLITVALMGLVVVVGATP